MVRVSEHFRLHRQQPVLDFVDVDIDMDLRVFVDPRALRLLHTHRGAECVAIVHDFFAAVLEAIRRGDDGLARRLLGTLCEPNETHLGLFIAKSRGRALGNESASDIGIDPVTDDLAHCLRLRCTHSHRHRFKVRVSDP